MSDMFDLADWTKISCEESETIKRDSARVLSSLTDLDGVYGRPLMFTEWGDGADRPTLRDYLHNPNRDDEMCEHYKPAAVVTP